MVLTSTGRRREYIYFYESTLTSDSQGGNTQSWAEMEATWARARTLSQARSLDAGGVKYTKAVEFTVRNVLSNSITSAHRILWGSDYYTIHSVIPTEKDDDLLILAYV